MVLKLLALFCVVEMEARDSGVAVRGKSVPL